jgi:hypothetical protein
MRLPSEILLRITLLVLHGLLELLLVLLTILLWRVLVLLLVALVLLLPVTMPHHGTGLRIPVVCFVQLVHFTLWRRSSGPRPLRVHALARESIWLALTSSSRTCKPSWNTRCRTHHRRFHQKVVTPRASPCSLLQRVVCCLLLAR